MLIEDSAVANFSQKDIETAIKTAEALASKNSYEEALSTLENTRKLAYVSSNFMFNVIRAKKFGEESFEAARLHFQLGSILLQKVKSFCKD